MRPANAVARTVSFWLRKSVWILRMCVSSHVRGEIQAKRDHVKNDRCPQRHVLAVACQEAGREGGATAAKKWHDPSVCAIITG
jgi:hypothetical protein